MDKNQVNNYISTINNLTSNFYADKTDVNEVDEELITTHVTANDLNVIKQTLSTLCNNVKDIDNHIFSPSGEEGNGSGSGSSNGGDLGEDLNRYLANEYVRKNQLTVDGEILNDSTVSLDQLYLQHKNIFVDGYKTSYTSPYNLVSYNEFNTTIKSIRDGLESTVIDLFNSLTSNITFPDPFDGSVLDEFRKPIKIKVDYLTAWGGQDSRVGDTVNYKLQTPYTFQNYNNQYKLLDLTEPFQWTINAVDFHINYLHDYVLWPQHCHHHTIQANEWAYGIRLLANGWAPLNNNEILDPQYKQFKWYRVYSNMSESNKNGMILNFDPTFENTFIGNNFPFSTSINSLNKNEFTPTNSKQFDVYHNVISGYYFPKTCSGPTSPTAKLVSFDSRIDRVYNGWNRGWMECGGQQRVYAWKEGNFIRFSPSTILFPLPFDKGYALDIQVTLKRDICQPFPYIIPVSVVKEDIYYFDIIGGGQGIPDEPTGFFYLKWEAKGMFLHNNIMNYYYMKQGYNTIQDIYNITDWNINPHYSINMNKDIAVEAGFTTQAEFRAHTKLQYVSLLYKDVFKPTVLNILTSLTSQPADSEYMKDILTSSTYDLSTKLANQYWHDNMDILNYLPTPKPPLYQLNNINSTLGNPQLSSRTTYGEFKSEDVCPEDFRDYIYACIAESWPENENIRRYWLTHNSKEPSSYYELTNKIVLSAGQLFKGAETNGWEHYELSYPMEKKILLTADPNITYHILINKKLEQVKYNPTTTKFQYIDDSTSSRVELTGTYIDTEDNKLYYNEVWTKDDDRLRLRRDAVAGKNLTWKRYRTTEPSSVYQTTGPLSVENKDYWKFDNDTI